MSKRHQSSQEIASDESRESCENGSILGADRDDVADKETLVKAETAKVEARRTLVFQALLVLAGAVTLWTLRPPVESVDGVGDGSVLLSESVSTQNGALVRIGVWVSYFVLKYLVQLAEEFIQTM
eukprot:CAMPEP_0182443076 /NCGR_PEP_ID=MMETSP1172-20130603/1914_1 /TAXON_ID=708627 /ORGANISM="Timspurckia oligopyrenoides, Strain CCMP3278" /LENGTH=124 /DNA_ID=CAMNT_0024638243 /DNA_START=375 /DNA_END=749 /DNA_ORIENTATION=+